MKTRRKQGIPPVLVVLAISMSLFLTGCGGGGGSTSSSAGSSGTQQVSGVAAAGAPIVGNAYLKDATGTTLGPQVIGTDGSFSFDVTGMTAPFFLLAEGRVGGSEYKLHSTATAGGTANINPLTNIAVASAAGVNDPGTVFANPANFASTVNSTTLAQAIKDLQNMIKPLLDANNATIDPITGSYSANHTGLDAVLDAVKIELNTNSGGVTVTDKATNTAIATASATTLSQPTDSVTTAEATTAATAVTDFQAITSKMAELSNLFNQKGANLTAADVDAFFAANYGINDGFNRTQTINDLVAGVPTSSGTNTITRIGNVNFEEKVGGDYRVTFLAYFSDGSAGTPEGGFIFTNENGIWKLKGNGYKAYLEQVRPRVMRWVKADDSKQTESGIMCLIEDKGNLGLKSAVITGPGLPSNGLTLSNNQPTDPNKLFLDNAYRTNSLPTNQWEFYVMSDTAIDSATDNGKYTIQIYDGNGTLIETRTRVFPRRPYKRTEITDGHFATFSGIADHSLASAKIGGTLTFSYAKPTAYTTLWLNGDLGFWDMMGNAAFYWRNLLLNQTSGSIVSASPSTWAPTTAAFRLEAEDTFLRRLEVIWMFQ
ncbi:MAG: hypothetical protein HYU64_17530 [Armatimonadetes bacterium]|nr:hypothetical protein [Armatimonadota bacterium]